MARDPIPTWCFALIVVRQDDRFLAIRESGHGQRWYLPAGRVEPGESFFEGARREALEEAGFAVRLTGIVRVEHTPVDRGKARMRVVFTAVPETRVDSPTGGADALAAAWVTPAEAAALPLRDETVPALFRFVADHPPQPLSFLTTEQADYPG